LGDELANHPEVFDLLRGRVMPAIEKPTPFTSDVAGVAEDVFGCPDFFGIPSHCSESLAHVGTSTNESF
jgi:hypothetical protein